MLKTTAAILFAACLLLSACGEQDTPTTENTAPENETVSSAPSEESNTSNAVEDGLPSSQDSLEQTQEQETEQETTEDKKEQHIEKTYHMNENYYIKPNDEKGEKKVVLLTFDDGPKEAEMINGLIDTLDKHDAKAIFFVNGYRVKSHPELLKLIYEREQIIGNHAWDHEDLKKMSASEAAKQVTDVQHIVKETIGVEPEFFRPPFGSGNDALKETVKQNGMLYMTWSNGSLDWDKSTQNKPDKVVQNVLDQLNPGSNILMHELPWTVEALDDLLTKLENKGYSFVDPRSIELQAR
ncbi:MULTISPECIES: polysaccharide deacetylase family protein [Paenibacillus]|uniref:Polysaccharide deacetylase n=1 Tax=Paenibacillus illinoisensis TaxID=59845 RepID=A0A2W0C8D4_9BACL|nr:MULTISPECIES: polysaccharide deacetylase family protein [Paenibacillus]PAD28500.1 xylanase deacetylase [Paenibacillus sp. 7523-1]PYY28830.1 Polysaccharide deacetylase [Paenibacillus illinoisensis]